MSDMLIIISVLVAYTILVIIVYRGARRIYRIMKQMGRNIQSIRDRYGRDEAKRLSRADKG